MKIRTNKEKMKQVNLYLRPSQVAKVKEIAEKKDIPYQTLIRSWITEKIYECDKK